MSENGSNVQDAIEAHRAGVEIESRFAHISLTDHEDDTIEIPIRSVVDPVAGTLRVEVFEDALTALEERAASPRRRSGTVRLTELESLIAYVNRYKSANSLAWANSEAFTVSVVMNDHPAGEKPADAAWRDHRAMYVCPRSPEWIAWCEFDGKAMSQEKFGDFIEARLEDLRGPEGFPKPLDVLTIARQLVMRTKGTHERQINPTTGESILVNKLENDVGSTVIPRAFAIGVPVFEGGQVYQVEARVRFAIVEGRAAFSYTLHRRKEIERDAFNDVRKAITEQTGIVLLAGTP